jgi:N-acylglucosamine-6-phosphate 2-epimerase
VAAVSAELPGRIVADVDRASAGNAAALAGAAAVATTLSGYTGRSGPAGADGARPAGGPDVSLVAELARELDLPVLAEGRYATPDDVQAAFEAGAFAVVVGTAITDPGELTRRLASSTPAGADG